MKMGIKRGLLVSIVLIVIAAIVFVGCAPTAKTKVVIYTGGTAGVYFPLGSKYAEMLNKYSKIIDASAVTTGASVTNVKAIEKGESQAALTQNDVAYYGRKGIFMFDTPVPQMLGVATWYPEAIQFIVRAESDLYTLADLKGKNVAVGAVGSGNAVGCEQVLRAAGVWDTINKFNLDYAEAGPAFKLGLMDCFMLVSGCPNPAAEEVALTVPIRVLSISDEMLDKLHAEGYPYYVRYVAPKGVYKLTEDVPICAVLAMLAVHKDLPDDVVYDMTKILFEHLDELRTANVKAKDITLETALDGMPLILHPGAIKYYEEKGIKLPAELKG